MKRLVAILVALIVVLAGVIVVLTARGNTPVKSETSQGGQVINAQVIKSFKISALTYRYTNLIYSEDVKKIGNIEIPFTKKYLAVRYEGVMEIGIDASQMQVTETDNSVTIVLPPAKVLSHTLVPGTTEVLVDVDTPFNDNKVEDYTQLFQAEQQAMEQRAADAGLLTQAAQNAKDQLTAFLGSIPGVPDDFAITINLTP